MSIARLALAIALVGAIAAACGFRLNTGVKSDQVWTEITRPGAAVAPAKVGAADGRKARARPIDRGAIVAVFDVQDQGAGIDAALRERLSAYLAMSLAATARFQVVPRSQLKTRLSAQKRDSYRNCYDRSCQIEIGRELAAQKTLSTAIIKVGSRCTVTSVLFDLRRAASEGGATADGDCAREAIVALIKRVVAKLGVAR